MAKRAARVDSDDDADFDESPAQKRPRRSTTAARSSRRQDGADGEYEQEAEDSDFEDDDDGDPAFTNLLRQQRAEMVKQKATVAQAGVVSRVHVRDFMCHKSTGITFGPQLNFIVGHNGSGKSAFLTAITVALGGKASATGRGAGLKELVRHEEGVEKAVIKLRLLNKGPDAYKPEVFGGHIEITRTIMKDGKAGGGVVLSDEKGNKVPGAATELRTICDFFNIQVDNPINILSQDNARQFLAVSTAKDKYQFFLKGTLLAQLLEDYDKLASNQNELDKTIQNQLAAVKELHEDAREAARKWKLVESALSSADELERKKKQLAWSYVVAAEIQFMQLTEQETIRRNEQQPLKERLQKARKRFDESNERLREVQTELNNSADADTRAMTEVNEIAEQLKTNKNNMRVLHSDMQAIKGEIETHRHSIAQCDADIASAEARNTEENADTLCRLSETLEEQRAAEVEARQAWQAAKQRLPGILAEESALGTEKSNLQGEINRARDTVADLQSKVARAGNGGGNSPWNRFPPGTQRAYEQIQREQWHGETPVGPLGQHVKLTDMRWQGLLEAVLGGTLNSFIATDKRDRSKLQDILQRSGVGFLTINTMRPDRSFDCSSGEPDAKFKTIHRLLTFDNELARQCLVNVARIESVILIETRREGDDVMNPRPRNVSRCVTADWFDVGNARGGGFSASSIRPWGYEPRLAKDMSAYRNQLEGELRAAEQSLEKATNDLNQLHRRTQEVAANKRQVNSEVQRLEKAARDAAHDVSATRDKIIALQPSDVATFHQLKAEKEALIDSLAERYAAMDAELKRIGELSSPLVRQREALKATVQETSTAREEKQVELDSLVAERLQASSDVEHFLKEEKKSDDKIAELTQLVEQMGEKVDEAEQAAKLVCEDRESLEPIPKDPKKLQTDIENRAKAMAKQDRLRGMSVDEVKLLLKRTGDAHDKAKADVTRMVKLLNALKASMELRAHRWDNFRRYIALRAKANFLMFTSLRGYEGRLKFSHQKKRLDISVKTDEATQAARKDAKSLSGGEKSFSTVAFLLTLWESVNCPIRGLDEFDVFQDSVNRETSIRMLVETAMSTNEKQHILITPNALKGYGPEVRIHKLDDPERNQGTISFDS